MRLEKHIRERSAEKPLLLMAHAVVGYPSLDANWRMLEAMEEAGVDLVELQLPFSEPIADGPWFLKANQAALDGSFRRDSYFEFLSRAAKAFSFPIVFMGYYNSVFCMGVELFTERLAESGGSGYILADLPPEEAGELNAVARQRGLDPILLMTPTNSPLRLHEIAREASGFLYCVARKGVTGKPTDINKDVRDFLGRCRQATSLPLALGFGIKTAADVRSVRGHADIAIVGTECLKTWENEGTAAFGEFMRKLVAATR